MRLAEKSKNFLRKFLPHYPLEVKSRFGPRFLKFPSLHSPLRMRLPFGKRLWKIFLPLLLFGDGRSVLTNFKKTFFLPSVQAEKVNPRIFPLEKNLEFERFPAKLFSPHFITEELEGSFLMRFIFFLIPLPISEKSIRIEPPFAQK